MVGGLGHGYPFEGPIHQLCLYAPERRAADVRAPASVLPGTLVDGRSGERRTSRWGERSLDQLSLGQDQHVVAFGWAVLFLVFVDELLAMAAFGVWGWQHNPAWLLVWALPVVAMAVWFLFASPKARYGGPLVRLVTKVTVFGLACLALYDAGHTRWAIALLVYSVLVNALAMLPSVRRLVEAPVG